MGNLHFALIYSACIGRFRYVQQKDKVGGDIGRILVKNRHKMVWLGLGIKTTELGLDNKTFWGKSSSEKYHGLG